MSRHVKDEACSVHVSGDGERSWPTRPTRRALDLELMPLNPPPARDA